MVGKRCETIWPHLPAQCQQRITRARSDEAAFIQRVNEPFRHIQKITELESEIADLQAAMLRESEPVAEPVLAE
jgi:hypothetical protein